MTREKDGDASLRYQAIVFDMGDILFDATAWRRALTERLQQAGIDIDYPRLCCEWERKLVPVYLGNRPYWDALAEFLEDCGLRGDVHREVLAFARRKAAEVDRRELFPEVATTLARLKTAGVRLAVLTDSESSESRVRERLAALGIDRYFDAVVTSRDIGRVKPQPEAYQAALSRLGVAPDQAAFVGHDAEELAGATACGITAIAFNSDDHAAAACRLVRFGQLAAEAGVSSARMEQAGDAGCGSRTS